MKKLVIGLFLLFGFLFVANSVKAACNPPECGYSDSNGDPVECTAPDQCIAKCCDAPIGGGGTPPPGGGGGGGGWVCQHVPNNCPAGTVRSSVIIAGSCLNVRDVCNLGTAEAKGGTCNCQPDGEGGLVCDFILKTYRCDPLVTPPPPTTPPGGCSTNPSVCGINRCCVSNACVVCPTSPPATPACGAYCPPPPPAAISGVVYNDLNNNCIKDDNGGRSGWDSSSPYFGYLVYVTLNATSIPKPLPTGRRGNVPLMPNGGIYSEWKTENGGLAPVTNNTVYLTDVPPGYRCSDCNSGTCPIRTGVNRPSNGINFYITNSSGASPTPPPALSAWWQAKDGDLVSGGNITSRVPATKYLNLVGAGGFPGVPVYGGSLVPNAKALPVPGMTA